MLSRPERCFLWLVLGFCIFGAVWLAAAAKPLAFVYALAVAVGATLLVRTQGEYVEPCTPPWRCRWFGHRFQAAHLRGICRYRGYAARICLRCAALHPGDQAFCDALAAQEDVS